MAFLDQLRDSARIVKETTSNVISEGKQNVENNRKRKEIQLRQNKINDLYRLIGIKFVEENLEEIKDNSLYSSEIAEIKELFKEQIGIQKSIDMDDQDLISCPNCGESLARSFEFCINCGKAVKKS